VEFIVSGFANKFLNEAPEQYGILVVVTMAGRAQTEGVTGIMSCAGIGTADYMSALKMSCVVSKIRLALPSFPYDSTK